MSLLRMSISAAVMIVVIIVIRALAINRLPKKTFLALWGIVLARLLLPFSWPSPLSFYSLVNHSVAEQLNGTPGVNTLLIVPDVNITTTQPVGISLWAWVWGIGAALCALFFAVALVKGSCPRNIKSLLNLFPFPAPGCASGRSTNLAGKRRAEGWGGQRWGWRHVEEG